MRRAVHWALGLACGIWGAAQLPPVIDPLLYVGGAVLILYALPRGGLRRALFAAVVGGGLISADLQGQRAAEDAHVNVLDDRVSERLTGEVVGPIAEEAGLQRFVLETERERIVLTVYDYENRGEPLWPGDRVEVEARLRRPVGLRGLGTFEPRYSILGQGASLAATARASDVVVVSTGFSPWKPAMRVHRWAVGQLADGTDRVDGRAIVAALATGDQGLMSDGLRTSIRAAGLAHLLAVSGMHMAAIVSLVYVAGVWLWCGTRFRQRFAPRAVGALAALVAAIAFAAITGARPSTCRALLVAALVLLGMALDRKIRLLDALSWAATALLLWRPALLWDVGFQMSFAAAVALALAFAPPPERLEVSSNDGTRRIGRAVANLAKASFWATVATAPIALHHFGEISGLGLFSNLVAVPFVTLVLLPGTLVGLLLSAWLPGPGRLVLSLCIDAAQLLASGCYRLAEAFPLQSWPPLSAGELILWILGSILLLTWRRVPLGRGRRLRWAALIVCLGLLCVLRSRGPAAPKATRITFVEVGQGDAAVIELTDGQVWLVDGGGLPFVASARGADAERRAEAPARRALLPYLRHRRIRRIDLAIVSHPHPDHFVGLRAVARRVPIDELWSVHERRESPGAYESWLQELQASGTRVNAPQLGRARQARGVSLEVLWPMYSSPALASAGRAARGDPILTVNDNSLVVRLDVSGRRVLFTGDIEAEAEALLVREYGTRLGADVVKVPHHGSNTSSTPAFVSMTRPLIAIISCGRANRFGFPAVDVEERWRTQSQAVLRTDQVGSVTVEIGEDGALNVSTVAPF